MVEPRIGRQRRVAPVELGYHGVGLALQVIETAFQKLQQLSQIGRRIVAVTTMENGLPEGEGQFLRPRAAPTPNRAEPEENDTKASARMPMRSKNRRRRMTSMNPFHRAKGSSSQMRSQAMTTATTPSARPWYASFTWVLISSRHQLFCSAS